jgi:hypothetical protein
MKELFKSMIYFFLQKKVNLISIRKLKKIQKNNKGFTKDKKLEKEFTILWRKIGIKPQKLFIRLLVKINGIKKPEYIPENVQYSVVEPILNNKAYALAYNDKNFFERYLYEFRDLFPVAVLRGINGVIHSSDFRLFNDKSEIIDVLRNLENGKEYILKPASETGGGANVLLIKKENNLFHFNGKFVSVKKFLEFLKIDYKSNFVLQHKLIQHDWFKDFNESSLNTVRMYIYRSVKDEKVHPIHAYIRFGKPGSIVDSSSQGGRTCGVSREGILNDFALGKYGERYTDLDFVLNKKGKLVPYFDKMQNIARQIGALYYYHRVLGFDFSVDHENNIRLMEINTLNIGVINQQMNSGPLYGEFTNEVIEYCKTHKKSIVLDFYV